MLESVRQQPEIMPPPPTKAEEEAEALRIAADEEEEEPEGAQVLLSPEAAAAQTYDEKLARARQLAKDNPKLIANLIKEWITANEQR